MNAKDRHVAAAAKINELESKFENLFSECMKECNGMSTDKANKVYAAKYKNQYDTMERLLDATFNCYWYTDHDIPLHNKQITHRAAVAKMRAAGLHRMNTIGI